MKKNELIEIIQNAVKVELERTLPKIVKRCITENTLSTKKTKDGKKKISDPLELAKQALKVEENSTPKQNSSKNFIKYTENSAINEILNTTKGGIPQEGSRVNVSGGSEESPMTDLNGNEVNMSELPEQVSSALTRDYSELMSVINKKETSKGIK
jgi:hypothetical protein